MKSLKLFLVITAAVLLAGTSATAAFTSDKNDDNKNKYSLKHLNKLSNNYLSFQMKFRKTQSTGSYFFTRNENGLSMSTPANSYLFSQKTTTTYVYPYKYTAKLPKFKAPEKPKQ